MMPLPPINDRYDTRGSRWLAAGGAHARVSPLDPYLVAPPSSSPTMPTARSPLQPRQFLQTKPSQRLRRSLSLLPDPAANSP